MRSTGTLLCLGSAAGFGAMAVFGKLAYDNGATVGTLLAVRFALAAALFVQAVCHVVSAAFTGVVVSALLVARAAPTARARARALLGAALLGSGQHREAHVGPAR